MKHTKAIRLLVAITALFSCTLAGAQTSARHWEYKVFAGYNLGGSSPLPLPAEIRAINSWSPGFAAALGFQATRWLTPEWGISSGLGIDIKGMRITADVKYMDTRLVIGEGEHTGLFSGMFTGENETRLHNGYLVVPLLGAYAPAAYTHWIFRLGGYVALLRDANFEGSASNGYIRNGGAAGDRIDIEKATFDFSDQLRKVDAGVMASTDWFFTHRLAVTGQLSWGLSPLFASGFNGIPYKMYNIYFMGGIAYKL
jgi:hypothetical protein